MSVSQTEFTRAVFDPAQPAPPGLTNPDGAPASRRFDVYRNNVVVSLREALATAFPVLRKLLGQSNFDTLASAYLRAHPPDSPLMMHYGAAMPVFLQSYAPVRSLGYLPDIARLEQALRRAYHAADHDGLTPDALQAIAPDRLMRARLRLAPPVHLIRSHWPVHAIWLFHMVENAPKPRPGGQNVLVSRPDFDPVPQPLPPGGGVFVATLQDGRTLGAAFEAATARVPDFALGPLLSLLLEARALAAIDHEETQ